jgi:hypothetical protein
MSNETTPPEPKFALDGKALTKSEYDAAFSALAVKARQPAPEPAPTPKK